MAGSQENDGMIGLDSTRWKELRATSRDATETRVLLARAYEGDRDVFGELFEQICHQFTASEAAYAVVPHLVRMCDESRTSAFQIDALRIVGAVVASRLAHPRSSAPIPRDLETSFQSALGPALRCASNLAARADLSPEEGSEVLATIAALRGNYNLSMFIFHTVSELYCPNCGESIKYDEV